MTRLERHRGARRDRKGAATVTAVICLSAFLGVVALAIDGGLWMAERRRAQIAADSAALAAASVLFERFDADHGLDPTGQAAAAAIEYAAKYGYTNDESTSPPLREVIVEIPPTSDEGEGNPDYGYEQQFVGKAGYVKVRIETRQKRLFSAIFGNGDLFVARRAVACGAKVDTAYSPAAIILLEPHLTGSLSLSGSARVRAGGGIQVKSDHSRSAISASGNASVIAPDVAVVGGTRTSGSASVDAAPRHVSASSIVDPLASVDPPDPATLTPREAALYSGGKTGALYPGLYDGGISASGSAEITLNPGVYYVRNGGFSISGNASVEGEGVMIFTDGTGGGFNLSGSGRVLLTAPVSGPYAGIVLYQDRNSSKSVLLSGGSDFTVTGTIYAAGAKMNVSGGVDDTQYGSQLVVKSLSPSGGAKIWINGDQGEIARKSVSVLGLVE